MSKRTLKAARSGRLMAPFRQLLLADGFIRKGGVFHDWTDACTPYLKFIQQHHPPSHIWAIFGNTSVLELGKQLSGMANTPWVSDFKDGWEDFIPAIFRHNLARRFRSAQAATALSNQHADQASRYIGYYPSVIRSGVTAARPSNPPPSTPSLTKPRVIHISGSLYGLDTCTDFVKALVVWANEKSKGNPSLQTELRNQLCLTYIGNDQAAFLNIVKDADVEAIMQVRTEAYMPQEELMVSVQNAWVNVLLKKRIWYHHKITELLAAGRPIICFPEAEEEEDVVKEAGMTSFFYSCDTASSLQSALEQIWDNDTLPEEAIPIDMTALTWPHLADRLLAVFKSTQP